MTKDIIHVRRAICGFCLFFALSAELVDDPPPPPNRFAMISLISGTYNVNQFLLICCKLKAAMGNLSSDGYGFGFLISPDFVHSYFGAFVPSPFSFPDHSSSLEGPLSREEVVPS